MVTLGQLSHSSVVKVAAKKPPLVSPYFVLRKKPWEVMVNYLVTAPSSRQRIFPITGMGGCGKTQLVSYFLQEYPLLYAQTVYVDASSSSSIKSDLQTWVRTIGEGPDHGAWEDALRMLNAPPQSEQWVLILDNADDPALDLKLFLPKNVNVTILVTSRNRNLSNLSTTKHLELGEMSADEALAVMRLASRRQMPLPDKELDSATTLMRELGYLAVALVQAGTYCYQLSSTIGEYLSLFKTHRTELMKGRGNTSLDNYERAVYATLDLSYNKLPQDAKDFFHLISFFHHTEIPLSAFTRAADNDFEDPQRYLPRPDSHTNTISDLKITLCNQGKWSDFTIQRIIGDLRSFSLVTASSLDNSLFLHLHPLIQTWSRDRSSNLSQRFQAMAIQILVACGSNDWSLNQYLLPHIQDTLHQVQRQDLHVNDLMSFGKVVKQQGHYPEVANLFEVALS
ncbi:hypothetical protein M408DRAFT_322409, partial [Serendipita vermifera MAFF 305830]